MLKFLKAFVALAFVGIVRFVEKVSFLLFFRFLQFVDVFLDKLRDVIPVLQKILDPVLVSEFEELADCACFHEDISNLLFE